MEQRSNLPVRDALELNEKYVERFANLRKPVVRPREPKCGVIFELQLPRGSPGKKLRNRRSSSEFKPGGFAPIIHPDRREPQRTEFMRVEPNGNLPEAQHVTSTPAAKKPAAKVESEAADLTASTQLMEKLEKLPMTRSDKIAAAKALVEQPDYPNEATLRKVAAVIADGITSEKSN